MKVTKRLLGATMLALMVFLAMCACDLAFAQEAAKVANPDVTRWAFLAASISTGLSALAAGIAVAYVGAAAVGAVSEKPEMAGRALIFVGLAEGIAIYGLIIAIMILGKV